MQYSRRFVPENIKLKKIIISQRKENNRPHHTRNNIYVSVRRFKALSIITYSYVLIQHHFSRFTNGQPLIIKSNHIQKQKKQNIKKKLSKLIQETYAVQQKILSIKYQVQENSINNQLKIKQYTTSYKKQYLRNVVRSF